MQEVIGEEALPLPADGKMVYYVRSLLDPYTYIHGMTGECYQRRDGRPWAHPGYMITSRWVNKETGETKLERENKGACCDHTTYPYKQAAA